MADYWYIDPMHCIIANFDVLVDFDIIKAIKQALIFTNNQMIQFEKFSSGIR
jgi:uncharacterized membrane protein